LGIGHRLVIRQTDDNFACYILDGWDACCVGIRIRGAAGRAIGRIVLTGGGIAQADARGILDDDPGIQQTPVFEHAEHHQQ